MEFSLLALVQSILRVIRSHLLNLEGALEVILVSVSLLGLVLEYPRNLNCWSLLLAVSSVRLFWLPDSWTIFIDLLRSLQLGPKRCSFCQSKPFTPPSQLIFQSTLIHHQHFSKFRTKYQHLH